MTVGTGLRGTLVTLGVAGAITGGVLVGLPRVLPASFIALPQSLRVPTTPKPVAAPAAAPASAPAGPSLDTVRLEPDGSGLVAGRADPGSTVEVLLGEETVAEMTADADGNFVAFLALAPSAEPRALSLRDGDGDQSDETVILAPTGTAPEEEQVAALATEEPSEAGQGPTTPTVTPAPAGASDPSSPTTLASSGAPGTEPPPATSDAPGTELVSDASTAADALAAPDSSSAASVAVTSDAQTIDPALVASDASGIDLTPDTAETETAAPNPAADNTSATAKAAAADPALAAPITDAPATPPILLSDADGVRVLQPALAPDASPDLRDTVALDAITYDGSGEVVLSGRATGGGAVRLYIDNAPVADAPVAPDGSWSSALGTTAAGIYTLRVDQVDDSGEVLSRIETPFQREGRDQLADAMGDAGATGQPVVMRIVQPGNTLWAIARERYGEPMMYVQVFEANSERIRNPDLIYPGQIFVLPATDAP